MKKILTGVVLACLLLGVLAGLSACGTNKELEKVATTMNETFAALNNDDMKIELSVEGNKLVYTAFHAGLTKEDVETNLNSGSAEDDLNIQTFFTAADAANVKCEAVIVKFVDADGKVLASREFKSK